MTAEIINVSEINEIWLRLEGESARAYEAFSIYRDMGAARSNNKVAMRLGKTKSTIDKWSKEWGWVRRVAAFDKYVDEEYRREQEIARRDMARRHAQLAMLLQQKAFERLASLSPEDLTATTLAHWVDTAVKVERLSRGESTENFGLAQPIAVQAFDYSDAVTEIAGPILPPGGDDEDGETIDGEIVAISSDEDDT